ncbi:MAG TPA: hypothetical protein VFZ36_08910 [Vicinamibacterales bacterium]
MLPILPLGASPLTSQQAAGAPIFRPCGEISASIARMQQGLTMQRGWIESAERQLRDAATGVYASREALRAKAMNTLGELISDQMGQMLTLRRKVEFLKSMGLSRDSRRRVLEAAKKAEDLYERAENMKEHYDDLVTKGEDFEVRRALRDNLKDLQSFLKFAEESGLAEEGVSLLALAGGPVGQLAASTSNAAIDWSLALGENVINERELRRAQEDLAAMRAAYDRNTGIIAELEMERTAAAREGQCPEMNAGQQQPASSLTPPLADPPGPPAAAPAPPTATPVPAKPATVEEKKAGGSDVLYWTVLGAGAGAAYLYSQRQCIPPSSWLSPSACDRTHGAGSGICRELEAEQNAFCSCNSSHPNCG